MFLLMPWRVDVPQDRWPVMNWLILLALVAVFAFQIRDYRSHVSEPDSHRQGTRHAVPTKPSAEDRPQTLSEVPGITRDWELRGWDLKGLFGYMWLHAGPLHLFGNMLFLWIFGNALCAKLGNLKYLALYILFGLAAGIAQLLCHAVPALGASGAINGVVGAYLVLFFENEITCLFVFWPIIFFYTRWFAISSIWIVLFWLVRDIAGVFMGGAHVAYFAHLGGFAAGFGITIVLCQKGWITMEKYEKSLLQMWQERRRAPQRESLDTAYAQLGLQPTDEERRQAAARLAPSPGLEAVPASATASEPAPGHVGADGLIRTACACGHTIRVTRQYAGRTVRCPRCRHPLVIPDKTDFFGPAPTLAPVAPSTPKKARDTHIHFVCTCGKRMKTPAQHAGRTVKCPYCGVKLRIPDLPARE